MSLNEFEDIIYEKEKKGIYLITLNRPERRNALSQRTFFEIGTVLSDMEADKNARLLIITGAKEAHAFSSGGYFDLKFFSQNSESIKRKKPKIKFWNFSKPIIAALNGYAMGAGITMILMGADLIYMAEDAFIQFNFVKRGVMAQSAMSYILPLYVGFQKAKEILYFGEKITANEAEKLGLVNKVLPNEELLAYARNQAEWLLSQNKSSRSIELKKKLIHQNFQEVILRTHELEKTRNRELYKTRDFREAMRALKEKRQPRFRGK
jgi:2-(1,2-epoxy-1,2-dihydrophenyl)acetyl-CoA isomerase